MALVDVDVARLVAKGRRLLAAVEDTERPGTHHDAGADPRQAVGGGPRILEQERSWGFFGTHRDQAVQDPMPATADDGAHRRDGQTHATISSGNPGMIPSRREATATASPEPPRPVHRPRPWTARGQWPPGAPLRPPGVLKAGAGGAEHRHGAHGQPEAGGHRAPPLATGPSCSLAIWRSGSASTSFALSAKWTRTASGSGAALSASCARVVA